MGKITLSADRYNAAIRNLSRFFEYDKLTEKSVFYINFVVILAMLYKTHPLEGKSKHETKKKAMSS